jgi:Na+/melibiose symporter-like transporter
MLNPLRTSTMKATDNPNLSSTEQAMANPAVTAYYADRKLMWRNVGWIVVGNFGPATATAIVWPLMTLRLNAAGVSDGGIGMITAVNLWVVSILVMYFAWKSDHLVSSWGRRIPYLLISFPFIVASFLLFPVYQSKWILIGLVLLYLYFQDMRQSTYPLLSIDCVRRDILARIGAIVTIINSLGGFLAVRYGSRLADYHEWLPYLLGGIVIAVTSLLAALNIKEPPIRNPTADRFTPFAAMRVAWRDRRIIVLMLAIAMLGSASIMFGTWLWFYARDVLGLTRGQTGAAMSWCILVTVVAAYPAGWIIDRLGSYLALIVYWLLVLLSFVVAIHMHSAGGLIAFTLLTSLFGALYGAGDMILMKQVHPAEVGSVTSTNSFLRNLYSGLLIFISGWMIQWSGNRYVPVFTLGLILTTVSIGLFFFYRHLMKRGPRKAVESLSPSAEQLVVASMCSA